MKKHTWAVFDLMHDQAEEEMNKKKNQFLVTLLSQGLEDKKAFENVTWNEIEKSFFDFVGRHTRERELVDIGRIVRIIRGE